MGKAKLNIPMCAALVLLLLTMITTHMTADLYAKYTTTASGADSARVAKFDVKCTVTPVTGTMDQFTVTVTNDSEVAIEYDLTVVSDVTMDATIDSVKQLTGEIFENDDWTLAPGGSKDHSLLLELKTLENVTNRSIEYTEMETVTIDFQVEVSAEQID